MLEASCLIYTQNDKMTFNFIIIIIIVFIIINHHHNLRQDLHAFTLLRDMARPTDITRNLNSDSCCFSRMFDQSIFSSMSTFLAVASYNSTTLSSPRDRDNVSLSIGFYRASAWTRDIDIAILSVRP